MKRLLKRLAPFAPDHSGAVSVLFELGGMITLCDAGGCTGNVCGFDEPRWEQTPNAIFSAALRDMDAIMGRDDRLVKKMADAMDAADWPFAALVGTPVPAVIGTDFKALRRMAERKTGKPVIALSAAGTGLYDKGEDAAYLELFTTFTEPAARDENIIGVLGVTPLELSSADPTGLVRHTLADQGKTVFCYNSLEEIRQAAAVSCNLVLAPAGLAAARFLQEKFGTPYRICCPVLPRHIQEIAPSLKGRKTLILHQQFAVRAIRELAGDAEIVAANYFMQIPEFAEPQDVTLSGEDDFTELVKQGQFDVILADPLFRRLIPDFRGEFIDFIHFAVSGKLEEDY